jgi:aldose 1-epimerase
MGQGRESAGARFGTSRTAIGAVELIVLHDRAVGSEVAVAPGLGNNCVRFRVRTNDGSWQVLGEPEDDAALVERTSRYGIPILYPWPNRIRHGRFRIGGVDYELPASSPGGHAIHGLVRGLAWRVDTVGQDDRGAFSRASVRVDDGSGERLPFRSILTVEHRLSARTLTVSADATNEGATTMPMGFGLHPWFGLPLAPGGSRGSSELLVPALSYWELDSLIPTGRVLPAEGPRDLRAWRPVALGPLDDVFTDLQRETGWFTARVRDPTSGRAISVRSDSAFREQVVYAPEQRDVVCLEPYTCATDAFNLEARGIPAGVILLEPGESWTGAVVIEADC